MQSSASGGVTASDGAASQKAGAPGDGGIDSARVGYGDLAAESIHCDGRDHARAKRLIERRHAGAAGQPGSAGVDGRRAEREESK